MIKSFKSYLKHREIHRICKNYNIKNYIINDDMSIDVEGDVLIPMLDTDKILLNFNRVNGNFICNHTDIETLKGCPKEVGENFTCKNNRLTSLEGMPSIVGGSIDFSFNKIKSFKGLPDYYDNRLYCYDNPVYKIYMLLNFNIKCVYWLNEYDVIQGDNIVMDRFEEVFHQLNMRVPTIDKIEGYNLI